MLDATKEQETKTHKPRPSNIYEAWEFAKPLLEPALSETKGTHTIDDVCLMVGSGHFTLWISDNAALLTELTKTPRINAVNCFICGGDLEELRRMEIEKIIPYAKQNGCTRITGAGRLGWSRIRSDWTRGGVYMHKDLT